MSCTCKEAQYHRQRACKHMYLLKRWHGNLTLRYERQPTAIQFSAPSNPPTQQPQSSTPPSNPPTQLPPSPTPAPIDDDHPTHDDDEEMVDADDLNKVWRKIYNAIRQETIPRDVQSSLFPRIMQQLQSIHDEVMDNTYVAPNARFQRQRH